MRTKILFALAVSSLVICHVAFAFEGRVSATLTRGGLAQNLLYTMGTNCLRIEQTDTNRPHARDLMNLQSGDIKLLFPHNRSFVRLQNSNNKVTDIPPAPPGVGNPEPPARPSGTPPPMPQMPAMPPPPQMPSMPQTSQMPPGVGPQSGASMPPRPGMPGGMPSVPSMPMPMMPMEKAELVLTNGTTNLVGFACVHYELRHRGEIMEIWATEQLFPYQPYLENEPHRFGPQMIEEQWGKLIAEKKLFPLLAVLRFENGPERMRFEVKAITRQKINASDEVELFRPPSNYLEIQPLSF